MRRRMIGQGGEALETRTTPGGGMNVALVGNILTIAAAEGGHTAATVAIDDATNRVMVDYSTEGLGGPFTEVSFDVAEVSSIRFTAHGDGNYFEVNTNVIDAAVVMIGDGNTFNGSLEADQVVLIGHDNHADGGGGDDHIIVR